MSTQQIRSAIEGAISYLTEHADEARYTDSVAVATLQEGGLRCTVTGPSGETVATDMPPSVGGGGTAPSPGWLFRAAAASCTATLIGMRAAQLGIELTQLEVSVDSESDDRGLLGMADDVPAGPLSLRVRVNLAAPGADSATLRELAAWGETHCPVCDAAGRDVPITLEVETG
ncbi:MAG: OsmC family protein [Actinomycetota bacterium]